MSQRLTGLFLLVFFLLAVAMNGVVLTKTLRVSDSGKCSTSLIAFDVCGHAHPGVSLDGPGHFAPIPDCSSFIPSFDNSFPPSPDNTSAEVNPGEIDIPPEA
ncbi:MAG: hypothetical protein WA666_06800 [Nitrospirota bacterium]